MTTNNTTTGKSKKAKTGLDPTVDKVKALLELMKANGVTSLEVEGIKLSISPAVYLPETPLIDSTEGIGTHEEDLKWWAVGGPPQANSYIDFLDLLSERGAIPQEPELFDQEEFQKEI